MYPFSCITNSLLDTSTVESFPLPTVPARMQVPFDHQAWSWGVPLNHCLPILNPPSSPGWGTHVYLWWKKKFKKQKNTNKQKIKAYSNSKKKKKKKDHNFLWLSSFCPKFSGLIKLIIIPYIFLYFHQIPFRHFTLFYQYVLKFSNDGFWACKTFTE